MNKADWEIIWIIVILLTVTVFYMDILKFEFAFQSAYEASFEGER